jgi:hypothetical protein
MKKNKSKPITLLAVGLLWASLSSAQESVNASGGNATGSGGDVTYSVGQMVYITNTGSTGVVEQGVQHAFETFTLGVAETTLNISIAAFPNPTADYLTLHISRYNNEMFTYQLYDMHGKQLRNEHIKAQQTKINMSSLPSAIYFVLVINEENRLVHTYKIIKK